MHINTLAAISPIDGRYRKQIQNLEDYFSEYALIKYRVFVEVQYLFYLAQHDYFQMSKNSKNQLQKMVDDFSMEDAEKIKNIEAITNHDVKAVEYFIKQKLTEIGEDKVKEWVHFGLTSQDINNTAIPLLWKQCMEYTYLPAIINIRKEIQQLALQWKAIPMLAKTHGQPASPTVLGKEMMVFVERISNQVNLFSQIPYSAKFGGATGNFNAHVVAFPQVDWIDFANDFVDNNLGLQRMQFTTQIEHYDNLSAHFDSIKRVNNILIDLCRDMWTYISMEYFKQKTKKGEVGSSAMPHKVNPIDFENAEGNLGIANALLEHLSGKLPISRLQRDLTDSTALRNIGVPIAHTLIALQSIEKGLKKLLLNENKIRHDLDNNWAVVAEGIQTILRRENYPEPYEALKELTRGKSSISKEDIQSFIQTLRVNAKVKKELKAITPFNYVGIMARF